MKTKISLIFGVLSFLFLFSTLNAQQVNTPSVAIPGKEHYLQGNFGYMAGKEQYQPKISQPVSAGNESAVAGQQPTENAQKAPAASGGEVVVLPGGLEVSMELIERESSSSNQPQYQTPYFQGQWPSKTGW